MRLLVSLPRWLGDTLMAEPTLAALHGEAWERLTLAGSPALLELLAPALPRAERLPSGRRPVARSWRGHDAALLLDGSTASALAALWAGIGRRVGLRFGPRSVFLTEGLHPPLERGRVPLGLGVHGRFPRRLPRPFGQTCVELAGLLGVPVVRRIPRLVVSEEARGRVRECRAEKGPFLLVQVGGRAGSAKAHGAERWAAALGELRARGFAAPIYLAAGPGEERAARWVADEVAGSVPLVDPVVGLAELAAWCAEARLVLSTDGGVRHLAQAVGTPRVTLFGPTDPRHTTESGAGELGLRTPVPCGPCHRERCPLPLLLCQEGIEPGMVAGAVMGAFSR